MARNATLAEIAYRAPRTAGELGAVEGFGEAHCRKYKDAVLGIVAESGLERIVSPENLRSAWKGVRAGRARSPKVMEFAEGASRRTAARAESPRAPLGR